MQKELLRLVNTKKDYNSVADEIYRLREVKKEALVQGAEMEGLKKRISELREFINSQSRYVSKYDEQVVRRFIEKVTVYNNRFEIKFKSETSIDVER
ncbi:hypothetical protein ACPWSR_16910 [Alloiococcus sp. CFN-8]|uniref:hypothetical protein n=1 Tax=Alloiococcus sp. CFN-8 TaxID=3416081 RepID=UPI003CFBA834